MRHGTDVLTDKPGCTTFSQPEELRRAQAETGRILSIFYSEHLDVRSTVAAGRLVREGAIDQVVNTMGLGPHRLNRPSRPDWFFDRKRYGGILTDIAGHQFEQVLFFADALDGEVVSAHVGNRANPDKPGLQDFGDACIKTATTTAYVRVDWMTPDGLPTWGDGRLVILGTDGFTELRKYVDPAGRAGEDHLFISDRKGTRHIDCFGLDRPFGRQFLNDETAMPQERCISAMKLALTARKLAEQGMEWAE